MIARLILAVLAAIALLAPSLCVRSVGAQSVLYNIESAYPVRLPGGRYLPGNIEDAIDSNSPVHWDNNGIMYVFASVGYPFRSSGPSLFELASPTLETTIYHQPGIDGGKWLEATYRDPDGTLYGWYHNEAPPECENNLSLRAPRIGMMTSMDEGLTWDDKGIIMEAPPDSKNCQTNNYFFYGGAGDFSVILDQTGEYFYFLFGSYHAQIEEQGVSIARMRFEDRLDPIGKVWKWRDGAWDQPGLGGRVTPIFPVASDWHGASPDAYWGPSIHYNHYLNQFVMVFNHAIDRTWKQEGVYISFTPNLSEPTWWSDPDRLPIDPQLMAYPQIIGIEAGETDKLIGRWGRLFLHGHSYWLIDFQQSNNEGGDDLLPPPPPRTSAPGRVDYPSRSMIGGPLN
jgi:hypothetical protein